MQTLQEKIKSLMVEAMKQKDAVRVTTLRGIMAGFTNELVALKRTPQSTLSDEEALKVIERAVKQRKDAIAQFTEGGRPELADSEKAELAILETFLPEMMSLGDIEKEAVALKTSLGVTDKSGAGKFMGALMKQLKGKARGDDVKTVVDKLLA